MKDPKEEDQANQKDQKHDHHTANSNKSTQNIKPGLHEKNNTQKLRSGEDPNFRSANNDTLGIP